MQSPTQGGLHARLVLHPQAEAGRAPARGASLLNLLLGLKTLHEEIKEEPDGMQEVSGYGRGEHETRLSHESCTCSWHSSYTESLSEDRGSYDVATPCSDQPRLLRGCGATTRLPDAKNGVIHPPGDEAKTDLSDPVEAHELALASAASVMT